MTSEEMRVEHNAMLRKIWATGHCDTNLQTELALMLDARAREIERLRSAAEPEAKYCTDCLAGFDADGKIRHKEGCGAVHAIS